jgi:basic membrane protein A
VRTQAKLDGSWKPEDTYWGMKEKALDIAPIVNVPDNVKAAAEAQKAAWIDGSYDVYKGPIKDNAGNVKAAEGASLNDGDILGMNWLAEGVDGAMPS